MFTSHNFRLTILGPRKYTSGSVLQCIWRSEVIMFLFQVQLASEVLFFALRFASEMRISGGVSGRNRKSVLKQSTLISM